MSGEGGGASARSRPTGRAKWCSERACPWSERPAPRPFAVTVSGFTIELPSHEAPDEGEIVKPVLERPR